MEVFKYGHQTKKKFPNNWKVILIENADKILFWWNTDTCAMKNEAKILIIHDQK